MKIYKIFAIVVFIVALTSCGSKNNEKTSTDMSMPMEAPPQSELMGDSAGMADSSYREGEVANYAISPDGYAYNENPNNSTGRIDTEKMIIKTGNVSGNTENIVDFEKNIKESVNEQNGYFDTENIDYNNLTFNAVVKIPAENLDTFILDVNKYCKITNSAMKATDVTSNYRDTQNFLETKNAEKERLVGVKEDTRNVKTLIEIENIISRVDLEISSAMQKQRSIENSTKYSTVDLYIVQNKKTDINNPDASFFDELKQTFNKSVDALIKLFQKFLILVSYGIVPIVLIIVFALISFFIKKLFFKKNN